MTHSVVGEAEKRGGAYCNKEERFGGMKLDPLNDPLDTLKGFLERAKGSEWPPCEQLALTCVLLLDSWWISTVVVASVKTQHMYIYTHPRSGAHHQLIEWPCSPLCHARPPPSQAVGGTSADTALHQV